MIDSCLDKFPLQSANIQISYLTAHSFDDISKEGINLIVQDLGNRNPVAFSEFVHVVPNPKEISPLNSLFSSQLTCSITSISFEPNSMYAAFKSWLDFSSNLDVQLFLGDMQWQCTATKRIIEIEFPITDVCKCHGEPLIGKEKMLCSETFQRSESKQKLNIGKGQTREIHMNKESILKLKALHRVSLSSISEEVLLGFVRISRSFLQFFVCHFTSALK